MAYSRRTTSIKARAIACIEDQAVIDKILNHLQVKNALAH
jgi:hypothetical protein